MITVSIYGKQDCCLCTEAEKMINDLGKEYPLDIKKIDITEDAKLIEMYRYLIPVVVINDTIKFELKISRYRVEKAIRAACTK